LVSQGPVITRHGIEAQTGWGIKKFVRASRYRIVEIKADNQTRTGALRIQAT
jgi:hypothetical protein